MLDSRQSAIVDRLGIVLLLSHCHKHVLHTLCLGMVHGLFPCTLVHMYRFHLERLFHLSFVGGGPQRRVGPYLTAIQALSVLKLFSPVPDAGACTARTDGTASEIQTVSMQPNKVVQIQGNILYISNLVNMYPWNVVDHVNLGLYHVVPMYSLNTVTQMTR